MTIIEQAQIIRAKLDNIINDFDDEKALDNIELFSLWETNTEYAIGDRKRYRDKLYECVQAHTSQDMWTPDVTFALWKEISVDEFPEWVQPTGAQDAYMTGDKVSHNNLHWISDVDNNVWEPGVFGWSEYID